MDILAAKTKEELDEIRSLRHQVNMKELGKSFLFSPQNDVDSNATLLYAKREGKVVGSLRCNFDYYNIDTRTAFRKSVKSCSF